MLSTLLPLKPAMTLAANDNTELAAVVLIFGGGIAIAVVSIITSAVAKNKEVAAREESRREIAAYVAEGSMTADEGERLLAAGRRGKGNKSAKPEA
jgi:hypothetical protein